MPLDGLFPKIKTSMSYNLHTLRGNPWGEIAGSLGDLGTLLPLMTAMALVGSINLNSTLIFTGIFNILSGAAFGVPVAVQPMKAIASVSLSRHMSLGETMGAGISVAAIVLFLALTGLLEQAGRIVPVPIVKGIQLGAGLALVLNAGSSLTGLPWLSIGMDNLAWAIAATLLLFGTSRNTRFPTAFVIFTVGIVYSITTYPSIPYIGIQIPRLNIPCLNDVTKGLIAAGIGQLPLTILNSIIAVTHLSNDLFPLRPAPSTTSLGLSVGIMNLVGCLFGSMPVCHGSGGMAGQFRFGARSGASVMILGVAKLLIGLFIGDPLVAWLKGFPVSLLGVMVFAAGIELAAVAQTLNTTAQDLQDQIPSEETTNAMAVPRLSTGEARERWLLMLVTAGGLMAFKNAFVGFAIGCALWGMLGLQDEAAGWTPRTLWSDQGERQRLLS